MVLDPFCGSGGTALAALLEGRKATAIDLSPAATFITKNYCTPVDVDELEVEFIRLQKAIKHEMDWLYETRCDRCDGHARTDYVVWSYVFECPRCLKKVPIFDCPEAKILNNSGQGTKKTTVCPYCKQEGHLEEISARSAKRFDPVPVLVKYSCIDGCQPRSDIRLYNDKDPKKQEYFKIFDLKKLKEISKDYFVDFPKTNLPQNTLSFRLKAPNINNFSELFYIRQQAALNAIKNFSSGSKFQDEILFLTTALLHKNSKLMGENKDGGARFLKGMVYIPIIGREVNLLPYAKRTAKAIIDGKRELTTESEMADWQLLISTQSATNIKEIPDNTIDYIFTDPPYGDKVPYGELNLFWEIWLGMDYSWTENEVIVNETQGISEDIWFNRMKEAFSEMFRVLKPGHWMSICYHDTSEGTWQALQDITTQIGLIPDYMEKTLFIETSNKSFKQNVESKSMKRDLVINFRKPRPGEIHAAIAITGDEDERTFSQKARAILTEALERSPGSTADRLYDELVSRMVRKGEFERHNFDTLLRGLAEEVQTPNGEGKFISRWYLLETAGEVDAAESQKESAAAERLEAFMVDHLNDHPEFDGVHYSDLFEQYLPVRDKPRRLLADWLPEFFYRTPEGTWRPPKDAEERQQKNALRTSGALRRVRRFTNAIFNSVPPAEKDRPENPATLAVWINECRRAGLYDLGKLLYEQGGHSFEGLTEKEQLEVQENYLICTRRSGVDSTDKTQTSRQDRLF